MGRNFVFGVSSEFYLLELGDKMVRSKMKSGMMSMKLTCLPTQIKGWWEFTA